MKDQHPILSRFHLYCELLRAAPAHVIAEQPVVRQILRILSHSAHLMVRSERDRDGLPLAIGEPAEPCLFGIPARGVYRREARFHAVAENRIVFPIGAVTWLFIHGPSEVEASVETAEPFQDVLTLGDQRQI